MVYNPLWNDRGEKAAAVLRDALIRRDPGSMELALQELANARSLKLDLQSRRLGDAGASKLAEALQATRSLEELELNLGGNSISKKGAEVLATALAQLKTLRRLQLNLWENSLGDDGVSAFANTLGELIHLEKLEFELLENNIGVLPGFLRCVGASYRGSAGLLGAEGLAGGRGALALAAATSRLQSLQQLRLNLASNWISKATQAQMKVTVDSLQLTQRELYMLNGVNDFSDIIDIAIDAAGDLYVLDGQHGRIVRIRDGVGEVVGAGKLCLDVGTRALYIGADGSIYFIDENGSRVQRYFDGQTTSVAGRPESGSEASQLEDAEDIFVTREGVLYVSDSGNNRIQKWTPGATEGVTVAGGNGKGSRLDQLQHPVGLHITEDSTIYIADYQNHRIMKWREGWQHGLVVAGGQGNGDELYQAPQRVNRMGSSLLT
ncbi:Trim71 [Symbiodinium microadriaticum]|nr:Trim71 [Symbiodinium microadriaticum]